MSDLLKFPRITGTDFAGVITETGNRVSGFKVGDTVYGWAQPLLNVLIIKWFVGYIEKNSLSLDHISLDLLKTPNLFLKRSFNPVCFWFLRKNGKTISYIAEVTNTFKEKQVYYIQNQGKEIENNLWLEADKRMYVSPFADKIGAVNRECRAVRNSLGILDASTLGKIDLQGPDVAKFLNLIYTNAWSKLEVGSCRYGLMCNEHGMVFDDGVTTRISENRYHMTTTTGGAARVMSWLEEFLQTEWLDMEVFCTSVTEQWTVLSISGPNSREFLSSLTDIDISKEAFPFMKMKEGKVCGIDARIFRISFTGELSFEINVPSRYGLFVWNEFMKHGKKYDITPYGTESMHVLRAEKGFIIVGQDTDGSVTPKDINMDWIVSKKKEDFLGKRSFSRSDTRRTDRKQLVGLLVNDKKTVLPEGSYVVDDFNESIQDINKTLALEPRHFGALDGLGQIQFKLNNFYESIQTYEKLLTIVPHSSSAKKMLKLMNAQFI